MNLYIYSDESGVFDNKHNDYFVFGGLICFGDSEKELLSRKYASVENCLRVDPKNIGQELKASFLTNKEKGKVYRSLNNVYKFVVLIKEKDLNPSIFENKKHKQRYLDYAYKMVLKKCLQTLIDSKAIKVTDIDYIYVYVDEHTTATDGIYELRENLLNEFKNGTFNYTYDVYFKPIFPLLKDVCFFIVIQIRFV